MQFKCTHFADCEEVVVQVRDVYNYAHYVALSTNRVKMRFRDACSLKVHYQEWEERPMIPTRSSSNSTSNIPKVGGVNH